MFAFCRIEYIYIYVCFILTMVQYKLHKLMNMNNNISKISNMVYQSVDKLTIIVLI